jgi:hypothetical protein
MARYVGVDLHRNQFTVCIRAEDGREDLCENRLQQLPRFVGKLRPSDEVAVELTGCGRHRMSRTPRAMRRSRRIWNTSGMGRLASSAGSWCSARL